ncbi:hypothetical protein FB451DRAFT_1342368 [Mycena latifolia]|nr:hypothetical protein FB451DRAFT_1342368 [Mycena latifolia]
MSSIRAACVTGAGQGIGRAIALRLTADGCNVAVGDLTAKKALLDELGDVDNLIATTVQQFGGLDVMVANAGVGTLGNILDTSIEELERVHAVNAAAKAMITEGRGGVIVGASSLAGKKGGPSAGMCSVYGSSKFAHHIRVNAFAPGATDTPLLTDMGAVFGNLIGAPAGQAALGTIGTPEAIAGVVSFLASKDSEFMTGQTLSVDGGIWFD